MKTLLVGAVALLGLTACQTTATGPDTEMTATSEPAEVCAVRDMETGDCTCQVVDETGLCADSGGVVVLPAPKQTGGVVIIPGGDGAPE